MRTIGRHWPASAPRGDAPARCSYCGVIWRRSQLVKDRAGYLACPDDVDGRDVVTLSLANAKAAAQRDLRSGAPTDGITMDRENPAVPIPGIEDGAWVPPVRAF
jgi:hypothetical protein